MNGCGTDVTRKTTCRLCDVSSLHIPTPAIIPTGVATTLPLSRLVVVFSTLKAFVLSLKEGDEVHPRQSCSKWDPWASVDVLYITRVESSQQL